MKKQGRYFLKDSIRKTVDFSMTDHNMGVEPPPVQKPCPPEAARVDLCLSWKGYTPVQG